MQQSSLFQAAAIAAGVVMWVAIVFTTPVTRKVGGPGATLTPEVGVTLTTAP